MEVEPQAPRKPRPKPRPAWYGKNPLVSKATQPPPSVPNHFPPIQNDPHDQTQPIQQQQPLPANDISRLEQRFNALSEDNAKFRRKIHTHINNTVDTKMNDFIQKIETVQEESKEKSLQWSMNSVKQ